MSIYRIRNSSEGLDEAFCVKLSFRSSDNKYLVEWRRHGFTGQLYLREDQLEKMANSEIMQILDAHNEG